MRERSRERSREREREVKRERSRERSRERERERLEEGERSRDHTAAPPILSTSAGRWLTLSSLMKPAWSLHSWDTTSITGLSVAVWFSAEKRDAEQINRYQFGEEKG